MADTPVSWHLLQAQARKVLSEAMNKPGSVDQTAINTALEIMRLPQTKEPPK